MITAPANWRGICESLKSVRGERTAQMELGEESSLGPCAELQRRASVLDQAIRIRVVRVKGLCRLCSLMRRTDHNQCLVCTSLAQTHLHQSYTRHSVLTGHLPYIQNAGTMYGVLGKALPDKAISSRCWGSVAPHASLSVLRRLRRDDRLHGEASRGV
jgi:hypothetical protein